MKRADPVDARAIHPELLGESDVTVALVGCGKLKAARTDLRAKDLYVGVPFRMAFRHACATADDVHILSALHGLVDPYAMLAPYDFSMVQIPPSKHLAWGRNILNSLKAEYPMRRLKIVFYAGQQYIRPIMRSIVDEDRYWTFENPLEGKDLFQRIGWFKQRQQHPDPPF